MPTALDVANVFLKLSEPEVGDVITNLKLQKLVYYAQGFHLAVNGSPIFRDPIFAWEHGPVVPDLYHHFKQYGSAALPVPEEEIDKEKFSKEQLELIADVNDVYAQFSAWKLRDLTHSEAPWIETPKNGEISHALMQDYFKTKLHA